MEKIKIGDFVIVKMPAFFEKCEVKAREKGFLVLDNGIKFSRKTLIPINSKAIITPYTDREYKKLQAYYEVPRMAKDIVNMVAKNRDNEDFMNYFHRKLKHLINRVNS